MGTLSLQRVAPIFSFPHTNFEAYPANFLVVQSCSEKLIKQRLYIMEFKLSLYFKHLKSTNLTTVEIICLWVSKYAVDCQPRIAWGNPANFSGLNPFPYRGT